MKNCFSKMRGFAGTGVASNISLFKWFAPTYGCQDGGVGMRNTVGDAVSWDERHLGWGRFQLNLSRRRDAAIVLGAFLLFHLVLWVSMATISHRAPPWDNIEQLVWEQSLQWGYYKHPPFPTWWLGFWTGLLGRHIWVTFFAAQLCVVVMLAVIWRLALYVMSPARALVATLMSSLLVYHGLHGIMANHNTVQLMPVALLLWSTLLAVREGGWWRWVLAGAAAALCMLTKYSALIWFAVLGLWMLQDGRMRQMRAWVGVGLALLVTAVLFAPHIEWLMREGAPSVSYVEQAVSGEHDASKWGHWMRLGNFVLIQLARALPMLLGMGLLVYIVRRRPLIVGAAKPLAEQPEWRFISFMAWAPVLLTALLGVLGVKLGSAWAATFFVLLGVWLMRFVPDCAPQRLVKLALVITVVAELVMALGMAIGSGYLVDLKGRASRSNFPAVRLADSLNTAWQQHLHTPLRVVVGETWLAGNVSVHSPTQPLVFLDADPHKSPWVRPEMIEQCGALVVVDRRDLGRLPVAVDKMRDQARYRGEVEMPWSRRAVGPTLQVEWSIIEPRPGAHCPE